jgi:hypothetical protein
LRSDYALIHLIARLPPLITFLITPELRHSCAAVPCIAPQFTPDYAPVKSQLRIRRLRHGYAPQFRATVPRPGCTQLLRHVPHHGYAPQLRRSCDHFASAVPRHGYATLRATVPQSYAPQLRIRSYTSTAVAHLITHRS